MSDFECFLCFIALQADKFHEFFGLSSLDERENQRIMNLLDFENDISESDRKKELKLFIEKHMLSEFQNIDTKSDLLESLKKQSHLNDVPLIVKKHFNIE